MGNLVFSRMICLGFLGHGCCYGPPPEGSPTSPRRASLALAGYDHHMVLTGHSMKSGNLLSEANYLLLAATTVACCAVGPSGLRSLSRQLVNAEMSDRPTAPLHRVNFTTNLTASFPGAALDVFCAGQQTGLSHRIE
jgi:hypothetical protein